MTVTTLPFRVRLADEPDTLTFPSAELAPPAAWKPSKAPELSVTVLAGALMVAVPEALLPANVCTVPEPVKVKPAARADTSNVAPSAMATSGLLAIEPVLLNASVPALMRVLPL